MARKGLYRPSNGLTDDLYQECLLRFITTITNHVLFCTAVGIPTDDFDATKAKFNSFRNDHLRSHVEKWPRRTQRKHDENISTIFDSPFALAVRCSLNTISTKWADPVERSNPDMYFTNGIQYVFEYEPKIRKPIEDIERIIRSTPELGLQQKYHWAGYQIISKTASRDGMDWKIPLPLQAADFVASEWRKDRVNTASPTPSEHVPFRFPFRALLDGMNNQYSNGLSSVSFGVCGKEQMSDYLEYAKSRLIEEYKKEVD